MNLALKLAILCFFFVTSIAQAAHVTTSKSYNPLQLASYNIRNYGREATSRTPRTNDQELVKILKKTKAPLIAVQEIYDGEGFRKLIKAKLPKYRVLLSRCGGGGEQKLGFVYNPYIFNILSYTEDNRVSENAECDRGLRPAMIAEFQVRRTGLEFIALALHLKAGGRQHNADVRHKQYKIIKHILDEYKNAGEKNFVLLGDFNTTDYLKRNHNYDRFVDFIEQANLVNLSEEIECTSYWWGGIDDNMQYASHLDHILVSKSLYHQFDHSTAKTQAHCKKAACKVESPDFLGESFKAVSDHCPVVANLK